MEELYTAMKINGAWWDPKIPEVLNEIDYSLEEAVSFVQEKLDDEKTYLAEGYFLSLLLNSKMEKDSVVELKTLEGYYGYKYLFPIKGLGYKLSTGELIINGNVGNQAGLEQSGGKLRIIGGAGVGLSEKKTGGITIVEENAGFHVYDEEMKESEKRMADTYYYGSARIGEFMTGGITIIKGSMDKVSSSFITGIIFGDHEFKRVRLEGWNVKTIAPINKYLPFEQTQELLAHMPFGTKWRKLVDNPSSYETD